MNLTETATVSAQRGLSALAVLFLVGLLFCRFHLDQQIDPDLFARMATGQLIAEHGAIPAVDVFAFTETKPLWIDHEWLSGLVFFELYQTGGELALYLFKVFVAALTFCFLFSAQCIFTGRSRPARSDVVWVVILGCFISLVWHSTVRSQVFTYLFLAFELYAFTKRSRDNDWLPLITMIAVMPTWANCHGGFVVGLGFLGIHFIANVRRPRAAIGIAAIILLCLPGTLMNPYGLDYWRYIIEAISMKRELIREWAPVLPWSGEATPLNFLVVVIIWSAAVRRKAPPLESTLLMLVSLYFAYRHFRFIPIPLLVAAVFYADSFRDFAIKIVPLIDSMRGQMIAQSLLLLTAFYGWFLAAQIAYAPQRFSLDYRLFPREAVTWLERERAGGNILSSYRHGNYLLWRLYPRFKVATDGRYEEVYTDQVFRETFLALNPTLEGSTEAFRRINPDLIIIDQRLLPNISAASYGQGTEEVYRDSSYVVFERKRQPRL